MTKALLLLTVATMSLQGIHAMEKPEKKDEPKQINGFDANLVLEQERLFEQFRLEKEKKDNEKREKELRSSVSSVPSISSNNGAGGIQRPSIFPVDPYATHIPQNGMYTQGYVQQPPFPNSLYGPNFAQGGFQQPPYPSPYGQNYPQGFVHQPQFPGYSYPSNNPFVPQFGQGYAQGSVYPLNHLQPVYQPSSVSSVVNTNRPRIQGEEQEPQLSDEELAQKLYLELNGMLIQEKAKPQSQVPSIAVNNRSNAPVHLETEEQMLTRLQREWEAEEQAKVQAETLYLKQQYDAEEAVLKKKTEEEEKGLAEAIRKQEKWEAKLNLARQRAEEENRVAAQRLQEKWEAKSKAAREKDDEASLLVALRLEFGEEPAAIDGHGEDEDFAAALRLQEELNRGHGGSNLAFNGLDEDEDYIAALRIQEELNRGGGAGADVGKKYADVAAIEPNNDQYIKACNDLKDITDSVKLHNQQFPHDQINIMDPDDRSMEFIANYLVATKGMTMGLAKGVLNKLFMID